MLVALYAGVNVPTAANLSELSTAPFKFSSLSAIKSDYNESRDMFTTFSYQVSSIYMNEKEKSGSSNPEPCDKKSVELISFDIIWFDGISDEIIFKELGG